MPGARMLGIIADDLSGALDTGVQLRRRGLRAVALLSSEDLASAEGFDIVCLNTDSRADTGEVAYRKARAAAEALKQAGIILAYKKMDSTLRGNPGAEIDGIMDGLGSEVAVVAPAFPVNGRITAGGYQLLSQVPVEETELGLCSVTPAKISHIPTLLRGQMRRAVGHIGLGMVMAGVGGLASEIQRQVGAGFDVIAVDSTTDRHLRTVAEAVAATGLRALPCGSAGLAAWLPEAFELRAALAQPVLVICGTLSEVTRRQVEYAGRRGASVVRVAWEELLEGRNIERVAAEAGEALERGADAVVAVERGPGESPEPEEVEKALSALGRVAAALAGSRVAGLVLTGGYTALKVCGELSVRAIRIEGEVLPGIPFGTALGGPYDGRGIVTKAGAFGGEDAIAQAIDYLKSHETSNAPRHPG